MAWISLVCLLALSSVAFGNGSYGSFSSRSLHRPRVLMAAPAKAIFTEQPLALTPNYGSSYAAAPRVLPPVAPTHPLTEFDILCKGQLPETIIPLGGGERFVVCLDDSKGVEQVCPKNLIYNQQTRRCDRKFGSIEDPCLSQPCLNGGQCLRTEYSYQCQCTPGYSGKTCELDSRICETQNPCGQSYDSICQSFHVGAALQYVCILQNGLAYGLSSQQSHQSPCQGRDGPHPLAFGKQGFVMCDGERMFVQSCPGGTIWDDLNKACVWPEMEGFVSTNLITPAPRPIERVFDKPAEIPMDTQYSAPRPIQSTYQAPSIPAPAPRIFEKTFVPAPVPTVSYGAQIPAPAPTASYGAQIPAPRSHWSDMVPSKPKEFLPAPQPSGY